MGQEAGKEEEVDARQTGQVLEDLPRAAAEGRLENQGRQDRQLQGPTSETVTWLRRHALLVAIALVGAGSFAAYTWAEWGYFCDQASSHHQTCSGFWSAEHLHDWIYNTMSNWQSEAIIGILLLVVLLKAEGPRGADRGDT